MFSWSVCRPVCALRMLERVEDKKLLAKVVTLQMFVGKEEIFKLLF